jgi:ATP-dependent RNA helicase DDX19/DBP5
VAPSRELARQIMDVVDKMGEFTPVTKFFASKGALFKGKTIEAQIIVGTPGTVIDVRSFLTRAFRNLLFCTRNGNN